MTYNNTVMLTCIGNTGYFSYYSTGTQTCNIKLVLYNTKIGMSILSKHWYFLMKLDSMRWFSHRRRTGGRHMQLVPIGPLPKKNAALFRFLSLVTLTFDLWSPNSNSGEIFVQRTSPSFIVRLIVRKLSCWQTNKCRWKHPTRSAMLRRYVGKRATDIR